MRADVRGIATCLLGLAGFIALDVMLRIGVVQRRWFQQRRVQRTVLLPLLVVLVAVPTARWAFIVFYFGAALLLWSVQRLVQYITEQQQQRFEEQWNETYRGLVLGCCPSFEGGECPCPCTHPRESKPSRRLQKNTWGPVLRCLRRCRCKRRARTNASTSTDSMSAADADGTKRRTSRMRAGVLWSASPHVSLCPAHFVYHESRTQIVRISVHHYAELKLTSTRSAKCTPALRTLRPLRLLPC